MDSQNQIDEAVQLYVIHNHFYLKECVRPYLEQREVLLTESPLFKDEINKQFETIVKHEISTNAGKALGVGAEFIMVALENINIGNFIKL